MAIVRHLEPKELERNGRHSEVEATVSLIDANGERFIQIDTYGFSQRALPGKTSQSLRLSRQAYEQLINLGEKHFK
jgi:hypothetical protein